MVDQQLREAPGRTFIVLLMLLVIWAALYVLLWQVLRHVHGWGLVGVVADEHLFVHFFLVLAVMLAFSNAILTFGTLFGRTEAGFLLGMPLNAREVVLVKWAESIALSSWSFLLLGVPLMLAVARNSPVEWYYYPLFLGHFLGFVAIPACLGLIAAWGVAMWAPRRPLTVAITAVMIFLVFAIYWLSRISQTRAGVGGVAPRDISAAWRFEAAAAAEHLDGARASSACNAAGQVGTSLFYLLVVLGNAVFLTWLTVNLLGRYWPDAYSRAQRGRLHATIRRGWVTEAVCWVLFFYLPRGLRLTMLKDLRGFARDARQWSQMAIMFGLLVIYVLNLRRIPLDLSNAHFKGLIAFLNLTTVGLILATFTSRFVYPLVSLESQQLWLLEMLPIRRHTILLAKFLFAVTATGLAGVTVMGLAVHVLDLPPAYAWLNVSVCLGVCVGLSGLSIGLGARFPVLANRNPARIASGFGGTFNLIVSMVYVGVEMAGVGVLTFHEMGRTFVLDGTYSGTGWWLLGCLLGLSVVVAALALTIGIRHFRRLEY